MTEAFALRILGLFYFGSETFSINHLNLSPLTVCLIPSLVLSITDRFIRVGGALTLGN